MSYQNVDAKRWLTDKDLTETGRIVREEYQRFYGYLDSLKMPSFMMARAKYFLQSHHYWTLPGGYALPPHTINMCVNNSCNLRCKYCDFGQRHDETFYHQYNVVDNTKNIELPIDLCKSIIDQAKWFRPIIRASFREPLMYKNILPLIEYTKENGLPFWLLTNGLNLSRFAKELVEFEVDSIRISLDGPEKVHNEIRRGKDSYRRMINGVKMLIEERRKKCSNMQIGFYFTLNDKNYNMILETVEQLDKEGVLDEIFINFQWLLYTTKKMAKEHNETHAEICGGYIQESTIHTVNLENMNIRDISEQAEIIKKRYPAENGYRIHFRPSFEYEDLIKYRNTEDFPVEDPRCKVLWYNMNINPEGDMKSFHHCLLPAVGNVKEQSIMDIWNGTDFRKQRTLLQEHGAYHGCSRCWGVYSQLEDRKRKD